MKKGIFSIAIAAMAILTISSCKKDDDNNNNNNGGTSRSSQIVGTWKETVTGSDDNGNNTWDAAEMMNVPATEQVTAVFNSDGTGTFSQNLNGTPIVGTTKWQLMNNDNDARIIISALGFTDTVMYNIVSFSSTQFTVKDTSATPADYSLFKKQ